MNTATILGKLEQLIDAAKLARKALKKDETGDAYVATAEALTLATDAVALYDKPAKDITA